jgi:hypothetical protein
MIGEFLPVPTSLPSQYKKGIPMTARIKAVTDTYPFVGEIALPSGLEHAIAIDRRAGKLRSSCKFNAEELYWQVLVTPKGGFPTKRNVVRVGNFWYLLQAGTLEEELPQLHSWQRLTSA